MRYLASPGNAWMLRKHERVNASISLNSGTSVTGYHSVSDDAASLYPTKCQPREIRFYLSTWSISFNIYPAIVFTGADERVKKMRGEKITDDNRKLKTRRVSNLCERCNVGRVLVVGWWLVSHVGDWCSDDIWNWIQKTRPCFSVLCPYFVFALNPEWPLSASIMSYVA